MEQWHPFWDRFSNNPISDLLLSISKDKLPKTIEYSVVDYGGYLGCLGIVSEILTE